MLFNKPAISWALNLCLFLRQLGYVGLINSGGQISSDRLDISLISWFVVHFLNLNILSLILSMSVLSHIMIISPPSEKLAGQKFLSGRLCALITFSTVFNLDLSGSSKNLPIAE